ncbi:hypothetical protein OFEAOIEE_LOCUS3017 [Methylorubrum extorquens]
MAWRLPRQTAWDAVFPQCNSGRSFGTDVRWKMRLDKVAITLSIVCASIAVVTGAALSKDERSAESNASDNSNCDTSKWSKSKDGSQSPVPQHFCTKSSSTISNPFAAVVGIGAPDGSPVRENDQRYLQRAQHLVQARTALDNTRQESGIGVNFINETGGGGLPQTNHNQKVALSVFALGLPGGANMWGINTDVHMHAGVGNYPFYGREADHTNFNRDYAPGGTVAFGDYLTFTGLPMTAGIEMSGNPNPGSKSLYYGILFQGKAGFSEIGTGLISDATIVDGSNSRSSIKIYGRHSDVINSYDADVDRIITAKPGQKVCFSGVSHCVSFNAAKNALELNDGRFIVSDKGIAAPSLPASGGKIKGSLCVDLSGNIFVKTTTGPCL